MRTDAIKQNIINNYKQLSAMAKVKPDKKSEIPVWGLNYKKQGVSVIWIEHIIRTMLEGTDRVMLVADGVDVITGKPLDVMNSAEVKKVYMGGGDDE